MSSCCRRRVSPSAPSTKCSNASERNGVAVEEAAVGPAAEPADAARCECCEAPPPPPPPEASNSCASAAASPSAAAASSSLPPLEAACLARKQWCSVVPTRRCATLPRKQSCTLVRDAAASVQVRADGGGGAVPLTKRDKSWRGVSDEAVARPPAPSLAQLPCDKAVRASSASLAPRATPPAV